jgi:hypothetical protein
VLAGADGQWVCDGVEIANGCSALEFLIDRPCPADATRPTTPSDCDAGTVFTCLAGQYRIYLDATSWTFMRILFNCECASAPEAADACRCPPLDAQFNCVEAASSANFCDGERAECGCRLTCPER